MYAHFIHLSVKYFLPETLDGALIGYITIISLDGTFVNCILLRRLFHIFRGTIFESSRL